MRLTPICSDLSPTHQTLRCILVYPHSLACRLGFFCGISVNPISMDINALVASLTSAIASQPPGTQTQVDPSHLCPTGMAGPEPSGPTFPWDSTYSVLCEWKVVCDFLKLWAAFLGQFGSPNSKGVSKGRAWGLFGGKIV